MYGSLCRVLPVGASPHKKPSSTAIGMHDKKAPHATVLQKLKQL
jgi:hypothetical protein